MLDQLRRGELVKVDDGLLVMTGEVPGLYAYLRTLVVARDDQGFAMRERS